ncbi:ribonuclease J [Metabacillus halosaccharovorans]|uniref:Ribonuclease J n=2 Tax=Metabacillus halosaccharovorans TaxID=930124 RepID=A0ABT3DLE2_9BACI|nr:ribonuclease J [Metabacillus halosaccharovorans]MCV9887716.1 ribonuclease J [Metabacillus halosaccharovorans]
MEKTENIKLIALGGVGEVGKNMFVVEINSDIFVVDAGLMYPEDGMLGIDMVIPDITYLKDNEDRVKGIFLTHGHDESIGGIFYLLNKINVPIYGTKLTLALVGEKLKENKMRQTVLVKEVDNETVLSFDSTTVSFFRTNHSIPDSVGISFSTTMGAIVHTGDFKFDQTPVGNSQMDIGKIASLGENGVLCLLSDSVNAEKPGYSGSEAIVGGEISDVMYNAEGRVVVAVFASNLYRIQQVINAAIKNNRKLAVVGKNMRNILNLAINLGYISVGEDVFISVNEINKHSEKEIAILTTSNHGDPLAVLSRMAKQAHKQVNVKVGDTVLIAATPIPGQELVFSKTIDILSRAGANVVFGQKQIHMSGHGHQEELKMMLNLTKPTYFIPVHGEYKMQKSHEKLAKQVGIDAQNIFLVEKGDVVEFKGDHVYTGGKVPSGNVLIDGLGIGDVGNIVLRDRRLLSQDGILIVVVTLDKQRKQIISGPEIITRGFVYVRESEELITNATNVVSTIVDRSMQEHSIEWSQLKLNIREALNQFLYEKTKRRPMILPIIMEI